MKQRLSYAVLYYISLLTDNLPFSLRYVLNVHKLEDNFYLNLLDWSSQNLIAVGLRDCVYLWNASTNEVTDFRDETGGASPVTSVAWNEQVSISSTHFFTRVIETYFF
jgi:hypothetical protein